ncbi:MULTISPECIES: pyocin knob domain-containing protein [unclassified Pantoea]|uniref:pyocin knob domain-containing protein n=1 Tax=unclassified Pantoea TaxID=2630326 RepID=UPI001CD6055C|nr:MULTISPECIES: pyocin knob domain-containing protein [unclassified Pantoea]MCA1179949.1 pyocin knob domain-containing protein [Pantoea sp. alder69]MCA1253978.1 pyocin knob domain-containing protein [Pantoea sp. alder70]MCA1268437.1 pyocin knob domain-containing protein [Pantoea sp. alder81]
MAWYTTGTIAVSGTTVTGTGTNFLDNTQSIGPGQALLIPGSGTVKMYEVASVQSATKLTLKTTAGTVAAGQAYAILSFYTDSVPDFARRLAAQLSYYQSQMDGWQQIMTGTGSITMTAPDGTTVTISSFSKLTADISASFPRQPSPASAGFTDANLIGPSNYGLWNCAASASYSIANLPEAVAGMLEVFDQGAFSGSQRYTTRYGVIYTRSLTATWTAANPNVWSSWVSAGNSVSGSFFTGDANTLTTPGQYGVTAAATNIPVAVTGRMLVETRTPTPTTTFGAITQTFSTFSTAAANRERIFRRSFDGNSTWTAWVEFYSTNNKPTPTDIGAYSAADNIASWITPTGANGWSVGSTVVRTGYRKVMGKVQLSLNMTANGAKADGTTMFTLPAGYIPTTIISVSSAISDLTTANRAEIQPDGRVVCQGYNGSQRSLRLYIEYPVEI